MPFCTKCGAETEEGDHFCNKCRTEVGEQIIPEPVVSSPIDTSDLAMAERDTKMRIAKRLFSKGTWAGWAFIVVTVLHLLFYIGSNEGLYLITMVVTLVGAVALIAIGARSEKAGEEE